MAERPKPSDDRMAGAEVRTPRMAAPKNVGLPVEAKDGRSLGDQRDELLVQIDELESTLRYMGANHPQRAASEAQLKQVRYLLVEIDRVLQR
jgi:hypothetical protein